MSGGHFDYAQYRFGEIAEDVARLIRDNGKHEPDGWATPEYSAATLARFREAAALCRRCEILVHRIDWLVSGDDGEDDFHRRLDKELLGLEGEVK
jgi:hypothetical protein